jgi:dTDP-4-dehydrorhamnose 3,5-epimerase
MLPGIRTKALRKLLDERGFFCETVRSDWKDLLEDDAIVQSNISLSYPGMIRAWHRHARGQNDYFLVLRGTLKICAYDDRPGSPTLGELTEVVSSGESLQVVRVPGFYWHGTKALGNEPSLLLYFVNRLYDAHNPDEERRPWNDPKIVDKRTNEPYDWNKLPFK